MLVIPAIDLKNGKVVRLRQGDFKQERVYSEDPLAVARKWVAKGVSLIHIVDLDGAASGVPINLDLAGKIAKEVSIPVELGGGIRTEEAIEKVLSWGIERVVMGTKIYEDLEFARKIITEFRNKVIVSIDSRGGKVQAKGWTETALSVQANGLTETALSPVELAKTLKGFGAETVIYTDISRDGMLSGPNIGVIEQFLEATGIKIIVAGGIACQGDILRLKKLEPRGVQGVIIGKALYEGKIDLEEAIQNGK